MIYVPEFDDSLQCAIVFDKDTIRLYDKPLIVNNDNDYIDYYINSHYIEKAGTENISILPSCIDTSRITTEVYYRNDFPDILIMFFILCLVLFLIPIKILFRLFRRFN